MPHLDDERSPLLLHGVPIEHLASWYLSGVLPSGDDVMRALLLRADVKEAIAAHLATRSHLQRPALVA